MQAWAPYLGVIEIILAVVLTVLVLLQTKGGGLGGFMGGGDSGGSFRTRRGVEATLHQVTIGISILFLLIPFCLFGLGTNRLIVGVNADVCFDLAKKRETGRRNRRFVSRFIVCDEH